MLPDEVNGGVTSRTYLNVTLRKIPSQCRLFTFVFLLLIWIGGWVLVFHRLKMILVGRTHHHYFCRNLKLRCDLMTQIKFWSAIIPIVHWLSGDWIRSWFLKCFRWLCLCPEIEIPLIIIISFWRASFKISIGCFQARSLYFLVRSCSLLVYARLFSITLSFDRTTTKPLSVALIALKPSIIKANDSETK